MTMLSVLIGAPAVVVAANRVVGSGGLPIEALKGISLQAGDTLSFRSGEVFRGSVVLEGIDALSAPVVITSTGEVPAVIDASGEAEGILIRNCRGIRVERLAITADGSGGRSQDADLARQRGMRCGIRVDATAPGEYGDIGISGVSIRDLFFEEPGFVRGAKEVRTANGTQSYGWGIRVFGAKDAVISGVRISDCRIENVSHTGIKLTGPTESIRNVELAGNRVLETGGPGIQMSGVRDVHVHHNTVDRSGSADDSRKWGRGSGYWCWGSSDILLEYNSFTNASGPADSAGAHIDYNCTNVILQYNFSANNAGGFVEILGNNRNCAYRFNISVNDGFRRKGHDGAFQEGKTLWLSGYCGKKRLGPYNNYIYNNTIYVASDIEAKFALENTASGVLIANNLFYIEGRTSVVPGDQYNPERLGASQMQNVQIRNNLYLRADVLPSEYRDEAPLYGVPALRNPGGYQISDYIPNGRELVAEGERIRKIPGDRIGLDGGLDVSRDLLGNRIRKPIIGAIAPVE